MSKPTDICIKSAISSTECIEYRSPIKFGGRIVTDATLLHVTVEAETQSGRCATGLGSMPMGNVWAWPSSQVSSDITLKAMIAFAEQTVKRAGGFAGTGHPLELTTELSRDHASIAKDVEQHFELSEPMPRLAQLVSASPLEAAIHDASCGTSSPSPAFLESPWLWDSRVAWCGRRASASPTWSIRSPLRP